LKREPSVAEVRNEIQIVLAARAFRQSRGIARLLRYLCGKALVEDAEPVTEYTIAMDVLGKPQDFKESKDSSVRVELHRLRKRLAEYYEQEGAGHAIRIVIPAGQYTPQFLICEPVTQDAEVLVGQAVSPAEAAPLMPEDPRPNARGGAGIQPANGSHLHGSADPKPQPLDVAVLAPAAPAPVLQPRQASPLLTRMPIWLAAGLLVPILAVAAVFLRPADWLDQFWRPVVASPNPILLCFGDVAGGHHARPATEGLTLLEYHGLSSEMMLVPDAITFAKFAGLLESKGKRYRVASQSEATFADLQSGPAVLIGLANNDWTERLVGKLRFTVEHRRERRLILRDSQNPSREDWSIDYSVPFTSVTRDYALVVRVLDPKTEQMVVTAAGLSVFGTLAAGEFLTRENEFRKIQAVAPRGWQQKNFELVLSTDVIRGKSGHPNIVAAHFW